MMDSEIVIVLSILIITAILLIVDKLRIDIVAILCMLALGWTGILGPLETISGFSSNAVITMIASALASRQQVPRIKCKRCGYSFKEFLMSGLLSCPGCYDAFGGELKKQANDIHGYYTYKGKAPARAFSHVKTRRVIEDLRRKLDKEVRNEDYEEAARLRDMINNLEQEIEKNA